MAGLSELIAKQKAGGTTNAAAAPEARTPVSAGADPAVVSLPSFGFKPKPNVAVASQPAAAFPTPAKVAASSDDFSLESLSASEDLGLAPVVDAAERASLEGAIDATAPIRNFPNALIDSQIEFVRLLDSLYTCLFDAQLFGQMVTTIMIELQSNQEYSKLMADQDVNTMIRGMRESMGMARIKKQEKGRPAAAAKAKKSSVKNAEMVSSLDEMFGEGEL